MSLNSCWRTEEKTPDPLGPCRNSPAHAKCLRCRNRRPQKAKA